MKPSNRNSSLRQLPRRTMQRSLVLDTCEYVCRHAKFVKIDSGAVTTVADSLDKEELGHIVSKSAFDTEVHLVDRGDLTAQYLLVVDCMNFCFWPKEQLEYSDLAGGLKKAVEANPHCIAAENLAQIDEKGVTALLGTAFPNLSERSRLLQEAGAILLKHYDGKAASLIRSAQKSAVRLVELLTSQFRGFQDHALYRGHQIFFYKRAQIFVGDIWGAFRGCGLGAFTDMEQLTMFADYRVPVTLRELGILQYSPPLALKVDNREQIPPGCEDEVEIRAATVVATERLKEAVQTHLQAHLTSVQLDWWLWSYGERNKVRHAPHHRTETIYY